MRVVVVGTGHVGLLTAATLAALGHDVVGIDDDEEKIGRLGAGHQPVLRARALGADRRRGPPRGTLRFEVEPHGAVRRSGGSVHLRRDTGEGLG